MKVLYINACVRKNSRTNELAQYALSKFKDEIEEINLDAEKILPLDEERLFLRDNLIQNKNYNHPIFDYAKQFVEADMILIAAPYWDLSFPAILKTYFENIAVSGITFSYSRKGIPISLCKAKKLIYITTAGGAIISDEYAFGYVQALAKNFYGIKDFSYIKAEGLDVMGADIPMILEKAKQQIDELQS